MIALNNIVCMCVYTLSKWPANVVLLFHAHFVDAHQKPPQPAPHSMAIVFHFIFFIFSLFLLLLLLMLLFQSISRLNNECKHKWFVGECCWGALDETSQQNSWIWISIFERNIIIRINQNVLLIHKYYDIYTSNRNEQIGIGGMSEEGGLLNVLNSFHPAKAVCCACVCASGKQC